MISFDKMIQWDLYIGPSSSVSFTLFSLNIGMPHPEAANHPLVVPCFGKSLKGQTDSLASTVWEEILVVQLVDGLTKFYFVDWRSGIVFAVSFAGVSSFQISPIRFNLQEHVSEERIRSNTQPLPPRKNQVRLD